MHGRKCLPTYRGCVVCGDASVNPAALAVRWFVTESGIVETEITFTEQQAGYRGIVHGGILGSLLDEALGWAAAVHRRKCYVTGRLQVEYKRPVASNMKMRVWGRFKKGNEIFSIAEGEITDMAGTPYATGEGTFFALSPEESRKIMDQLYFDPAFPDRIDPREWF